jgi:uncharacterized membrane protein
MSDSNKTFISELRVILVRGSVVIIPVALTYWFFSALLNAIDGILSPLFEQLLGRPVPGLGFVSMVVLVLIVGLLSRNLVGRVLFRWFEKLVASVPLVRGVYGAIKDLIGAFTVGGEGRTFRQVVLVEYPRAGLYTIAFVTNEMTFTDSRKKTIDFVNVYIPNPPNPTSGVLILVPKKDVVVLDLTIEQGLKLVLSGGIVTPDVLAQKSIVTV